jgi:hypothetical protein
MADPSGRIQNAFLRYLANTHPSLLGLRDAMAPDIELLAGL